MNRRPYQAPRYSRAFAEAPAAIRRRSHRAELFVTYPWLRSPQLRGVLPELARKLPSAVHRQPCARADLADLSSGQALDRTLVGLAMNSDPPRCIRYGGLTEAAQEHNRGATLHFDQAERSVELVGRSHDNRNSYPPATKQRSSSR
jgi:hypothetical protein